MSYPVGEGLVYTRTEGSNDRGAQKANVLTYTPNPGVSPLAVYADDRLYGSRATITNAARYLENQGKNVIGGANADFFVVSTGIPIGLVIKDGELISSDAWQYAIGFRADGSAVLGQPTMGIKVSGASGSVNVSYINKTRTSAGAYLLDRNYDSSSHFSENGTNIILERLDNTPMRPNGEVRLRVINKGRGDIPITITDNQMVLTKSDRANVPSWADFQIGEEVSLNIYAGDARWNDVQYAVGGKLLLQNGNITTDGIDAGATPRARTGVGVLPDGKLVLYEADGDQPDRKGLTAWELGNELLSLGCSDAICLDGGGSSAMALKMPGENSVSLVSKPSDGSERACANYIFFVGNNKPDGVTAHAILTPEYRFLTPGASTTFTVAGADSAYGNAPAPENLTYTVLDERGSVNGNVFTASDKPGPAIIQCSNGSVDGFMSVYVANDADSVAITYNGKAVESVAAPAGGKIDLGTIAYYQGQRMAVAGTACKWSVSEGLGFIDGNGAFTASEARGEGTITCSFGSVSKTIKLTIGMGTPQQTAAIEDFEKDGSYYSADNVTLTRTIAHDETAMGYGSLKAAYASSVTSETILFPAASVAGMKYVNLLAKGNNPCPTLIAVFEGSDGEELASPFSAPVTENWQQLSALVPENAETFKGIKFVRIGMGSGESSFYLDNIALSEKHPITSTDAPVVSLSNTELKVNKNEAATITGTTSMDNGSFAVRARNISVKLDGKPLENALKTNGAQFTVTTPALTEGTHCVTIEAMDDAGNLARGSVTITAGNPPPVFEDTKQHWASGYASLLSTRGIMQGENKNGVSYFSPNRNLTRAEFAAIMARALGLDTAYDGKLEFKDDAEIQSWARGPVYAVLQKGLMNGKSDSNGNVSFAPRAAMTRAEVMTVISRSLKKGYPEASLNYKDAGSIPSWALPYVKTCVSAGIIGGYSDNTLRPLGKITRGEIAKILALY